MAEPMERALELEVLLKAINGRGINESIKQDICSSCGRPATNFKNDTALKEYTISGLCQNCQDNIFSPNEFDG